jgi:Xaa-Pro aminopeptidase
MNRLNPRLNTPISTAELERRWKAVRTSMAERNIDVLLMQNNNDHMGGAVKYFTDMPAVNGYAVAVIFPREDDMTVVMQGPFGGVQKLAHEGNGTWRGVREILTTPSYASAVFTNDYDSELVVKALQPYAEKSIGLIGTYQMSYTLVDYVRRTLSKATYTDASDLLDRIRCIKSPEEIALIRRTAEMQDGAMRAAFAAVRPGVLDSSVAATAQFYSQTNGSEQGIYMCGSFPLGSPQKFGSRHMQNRFIEAGDEFALLVEDNGPGGFYCELGRSCVVGKVPQEMKDEFAISLAARQVIVDMLKPGTPCAEIAEAFNDFMRKNKRDEERRLNAHSQGYDLVERPLLRADETMVIAKNMNISIHPQHIAGGCFSWVCDNFLVGDGGPDRIHKILEEIVEIAL